MWNVITIDNKYYPDTDRLVLGYYVRIGELIFRTCRYNKENGRWFNENGQIINTPDFWSEHPDFAQTLT